MFPYEDAVIGRELAILWIEAGVKSKRGKDIEL